MSERKLLGDYLEELVNGWCRHDKTDDNRQVVQALRCPECIGDTLAEVEKQARAEVLAACIHEMKTGRTRVNFGLMPEVMRALEWLEQDFLKLQPAAKALEALLEKARDKGWNEAVEIAIKWNELSFSQDSFSKWMHTQRLEKARAREG